MVSGLATDFAVYSFNVFRTDFRGFWGAFYQANQDVYQFSWQLSDPVRRQTAPSSYTAQIRINRDKVTVYQESQTFARKQAAVAWAKRRETELADPDAIERASRVGQCHLIDGGEHACSIPRKRRVDRGGNAAAHGLFLCCGFEEREVRISLGRLRVRAT